MIPPAVSRLTRNCSQRKCRCRFPERGGGWFAVAAGVMRQDLIGHSEEGRPILALQMGVQAAPLRILIVSGQHGDEHRGWMAVQMEPGF